MTESDYPCDECGETAIFTTTEKYAVDQISSVTVDEFYCPDCIKDAEPSHLDKVSDSYEYRIEPVPWEFGMVEVGDSD